MNKTVLRETQTPFSSPALSLFRVVGLLEPILATVGAEGAHPANLLQGTQSHTHAHLGPL